MPRVGVLLSGCGVQDGSEIYETVLTILALEKAGATWQAMAPDIEQVEVVNHYTGAEDRLATRDVMSQPSRNVLPEAARIVRGKIVSLGEVSAHDVDALIIPGGYGVVKNLCSFAADGEEATVNPDVARLITEMHGLRKPIGALCIAPVLIALTLRGQNVGLTVGNDATTSLAVNRLDAQHQVTSVDQIFVDERHNIVSTPAFMLAETASQAEEGITKLVDKVLQLIPLQTQ